MTKLGQTIRQLFIADSKINLECNILLYGKQSMIWKKKKKSNVEETRITSSLLQGMRQFVKWSKCRQADEGIKTVVSTYEHRIM